MTRWSSEAQGFVDEVEVVAHRIERENRPTLIEIIVEGAEPVSMTLDAALWVADRIHEIRKLEQEASG
jgi:hypothetical protein